MLMDTERYSRARAHKKLKNDRADEHHPSEGAHACTAITWFTILVCWPEPGGPISLMFFPMREKRGERAENTGGELPTMMDRRASLAPTSPPTCVGVCLYSRKAVQLTCSCSDMHISEHKCRRNFDQKLRIEMHARL